MSKNEKNNGVGKFVLGAAVGAGLGILFAPKSGKETRADIKEKTSKLAEEIKNLDKDEVKAKLTQKLEELKHDLENLDKETVKEAIKEKGNALLKKADELIDVAKEKSAPVIEKAADDIRNKTITILKGALDKLENPKDDAKDTAKKLPKKKAA